MFSCHWVVNRAVPSQTSSCRCLGVDPTAGAEGLEHVVVALHGADEFLPNAAEEGWARFRRDGRGMVWRARRTAPVAAASCSR